MNRLNLILSLAFAITTLGASSLKAGCATITAPTQATFNRNGGYGTVLVSAAPNCRWVVSTAGAGFLQITSPRGGAGAGRVTYTVKPNTTGRVRGAVLSTSLPYAIDDPCTALGGRSSTGCSTPYGYISGHAIAQTP